jgi:hypothetical protein
MITIVSEVQQLQQGKFQEINGIVAWKLARFLSI